MKNLMQQYGWTTPFRPMNAKDSGKKKEALLDNDNYIAEEKLDGARYYYIDGRLFSRKLSVKDNFPVERTGNVPHIIEVLKRLPKGTMIDGEIHFPGERSNRVTSIMGALPKLAIERQTLNPITYTIYDIPYYKGENLTQKPWTERRALLEKVYNAYLKGDPNVLLSGYHIGTENKRGFLKTVLEKGGEGIMLKNVNAPYVPDARPNDNWYKIKHKDTEDVVIMGFENGKGKYEGMVGAIVFGMYKNGALTRLGASSGITDAMRLDMTRNPNKYIGKVMEISFMERTEGGHFRHPQFEGLREDKNARDCRMEENG